MYFGVQIYGLGERAAVPDCSTADQDMRAGWVRLPNWANSVRLSTVRAAPEHLKGVCSDDAWAALKDRGAAGGIEFADTDSRMGIVGHGERPRLQLLFKCVGNLLRER